MIEADLVLVAVGAAPDTGWYQNTPGIDLDDGVLTDATCMAAPGVAAVGDTARWWHRRSGTHVRVEHWDRARNGPLRRRPAAGPRQGARCHGGCPVRAGAVDVVRSVRRQVSARRSGATSSKLVWIDGTPEDAAWAAVTHDGSMVRSVLGYNRNAKVMRTRMKIARPDGLPLAELVG